MSDRKVIYLDDAIDALKKEQAYYASEDGAEIFYEYNHAIKALKNLPSAEPEYYDYSDIDLVWKYYAEEQDIKLTDGAKQLKDAMWVGYRKGKQDAQPEWIPCSERLPKEEKESYWVCTDGGYQHECRWTNTNPLWTHLTTNWHWNIFDIPQYSKVVAWMPLPEPYKERREE